MPFVIGVLSDTHGVLSKKAVAALQGSDLIIHAGDICSANVLFELETIAPVRAVLGNCDHDDLGASVRFSIDTVIEGVSFRIVHRPQDTGVTSADVVVNGHTHVSLLEQHGCQLFVNPGSVTRPLGEVCAPSIARLVLENGKIVHSEICYL